jgi:methyl-accepting chemotaxis protein
MGKLKIGGRVFLVSFFLVLAGVITVSLVSSLVFVRSMHEDMDYTLVTAMDGLNKEIHSAMEHMRVFGRVFTDMEALISLIEQNDVRGLNELMASYMSISQLDNATVANAEGIVLCRPHAPYHIGDDVSNTGFLGPSLKGQTVMVIESVPTVELGLFYSVPVMKGAEIAGAISIGINLGDPDWLDRLSNMYRTELAFFFGDKRVSTTIREDGRKA